MLTCGAGQGPQRGRHTEHRGHATQHTVEMWVGEGELSSISSRLRTRQSWGRLREGWDSSCCWGQAQGSSTATSRAGEEVLSFQCLVQKVKAFPYRIYDYRGQLFLLHYQLTGRKKRKKNKASPAPISLAPSQLCLCPGPFSKQQSLCCPGCPSHLLCPVACPALHLPIPTLRTCSPLPVSDNWVQ